MLLYYCRELSRFIASGRLHCRIDKVGGVVVTNRPDSKNFLYQVSGEHNVVPITVGPHLLINRGDLISGVD